jgi:hypothetical protein
LATQQGRRRGRPSKRKPADNPTLDWVKDKCRGVSFWVAQRAAWVRNLAHTYRFVGRLVEAVTISTPPYLLSQYYQTDKFATQIKTDWPLVSSILDHHVVVGTLLAGAWAFVLLGLLKWLANITQEQPEGWHDASSRLLVALDNIVGAKEQRFSRHLLSSIKSGVQADSGAVFQAITQPTQQLNELVHGIYSCIDSLLRSQLTGKYVLKVNLAAVDSNGNVSNIFFHYPSNHPVRSKLDDLNKPNSTIKNAIRTRKIVVLESILLESRKSKARFVVSDDSRAGEDGSLFCYPIVYDALASVVFVVSGHVDRPGVFKSKFASSYGELLKPFALRMKLEYALMALKEATNGQGN